MQSQSSWGQQLLPKNVGTVEHVLSHSTYMADSLDQLLKTAKVVPAVNQVEYALRLHYQRRYSK